MVTRSRDGLVDGASGWPSTSNDDALRIVPPQQIVERRIEQRLEVARIASSR